ncbi:MAG: TRAP transporter small permease subunit [Polyangiaceae bacterium]|jgi:TRAP-type mannitol/chloroaromatic compound transport system permease small subunit
MADDADANKATGARDQSPLERLDAAWQRIESRLCAAVLVAEIVSLTLWISLKGLSSDYLPGGSSAGLVYRCMVTATAAGVVSHLVTRKRVARVHALATTIAVVTGLVAGRLWVHAGVAWSSNVLNWLQNASSLMLIGGLRGLATRLTLWVALLGASLATSRGKHIHVDVLIRYVPERLRRPTAVVGQLAAMLVCVFGAIGFVDYIAISVYRADATKPCPGDATKSCDTTAGEKAETVEHKVASDFFLLGRQASLDWKSVGTVIGGTPYDKWMTATEWNAWLDGADWTAHFEKNAVDAVRMDPTQPEAKRMPQVPVPGTGEEARGLLVRELDFVFPFGLIVIAIKFLVRILLILSGRIEVDPEAAHADEELANAKSRDEEAAKEVAA